jgi:hypothetical protein
MRSNTSTNLLEAKSVNLRERFKDYTLTCQGLLLGDM